MEVYGGTFGQEPGLPKKNSNWLPIQTKPPTKCKQLPLKKTPNTIQAVLSIKGTDSKHYSKLKNMLKQDYAKGNDSYSLRIPLALNLLNINKSTLLRSYRKAHQEQVVAIVQSGIEEDRNKLGKCFHCDQPLHQRMDCSLMKYETAIANMNVQDNGDSVESKGVEESVGLIECAFIEHYSNKLNPNHI